MTCFSIQKFLLAAILIFALPVAALAQTSSLDAKQQKAAESKARAEMNKRDDGRVESPIVIELYTTSDCTACIYADRMLYDAMKDKSVIALSCHINDLTMPKQKDKKEGLGEDSGYEGPMDPCVFRQWTYEARKVSQDITTKIPNFVFNGYDQIGAGSLTYFNTMLNSYHYAYKNKVLEVFMTWKDDDTITIHLPQRPNNEKEKINASVWIIRYKDMAVEKIEEGVNKGRVLRFSNIIQSIRHIAKWHGDLRTIDVDVPKPEGGTERGGYVVSVAETMGDPVVAAGKIEDYPHPNDVKKATGKDVVTPTGATGAAGKVPSPERNLPPSTPNGSLPSATPIKPGSYITQ